MPCKTVRDKSFIAYSSRLKRLKNKKKQPCKIINI